MEVKRTFRELKIKDLSTTNPYVSLDGRISGVMEKEMEKNEDYVWAVVDALKKVSGETGKTPLFPFYQKACIP